MPGLSPRLSLARRVWLSISDIVGFRLASLMMILRIPSTSLGQTFIFAIVTAYNYKFFSVSLFRCSYVIVVCAFHDESTNSFDTLSRQGPASFIRSMLRRLCTQKVHQECLCLLCTRSWVVLRRLKFVSVGYLSHLDVYSGHNDSLMACNLLPFQCTR